MAETTAATLTPEDRSGYVDARDASRLALPSVAAAVSASATRAATNSVSQGESTTRERETYVLAPSPSFRFGTQQTECVLCESHRRVEELVERSSLGDVEAKAARESVPREVGTAIALAARYLGERNTIEAELAVVRGVVEKVRAENTELRRLVRGMLDETDYEKSNTLHGEAQALLSAVPAAEEVTPLQRCLRCRDLCQPGLACVSEHPEDNAERPCKPAAEEGQP